MNAHTMSNPNAIPDEEPAWIPEAVVYAWLRDRAAQYDQASGSFEAISLLADAAAKGDIRERWAAGELDDLLEMQGRGDLRCP